MSMFDRLAIRICMHLSEPMKSPDCATIADAIRPLRHHCVHGGNRRAVGHSGGDVFRDLFDGAANEPPAHAFILDNYREVVSP